MKKKTEVEVMSVDFTGQELKDIQDAADERDITVEQLVKNAVMEDLYR